MYQLRMDDTINPSTHQLTKDVALEQLEQSFARGRRVAGLDLCQDW
jgi:hypothetical protein